MYWVFFLNVLLLLLITIDVVTFSPRLFKNRTEHVKDMSNGFIACDTCSNPDIYLIIADEYAGKTELKDIFSFDNSAFEKELKERGFHITNNTKSNYNTTAYSMASLFSMGYITKLEKKIVNHRDMFICRNLINNNNLLRFLKDKSYKALNYSPFVLDNKKNFVVSTFFVSKKELFLSQTFAARFWSAISYHFITEKDIKAEKDRHIDNTDKIEKATLDIALQNKITPKFVYTHFSIPHYPYYYDSIGRKKEYNVAARDYPSEKKDYIQYLQYANKKFLSLIDHIKTASAQPPIIILMSDHGYRQFFTETADQKYYFMTLNTVYLPNGNYSGFYDGMSNVNQFRVILNSQFGQTLPMLKDSSSYLKDY